MPWAFCGVYDMVLQTNGTGKSSGRRRRGSIAPLGELEEVKPSEAVKVIGVRGLKNIGGRIQEEYLAVLKDWQKWVRIILEMQDDVIIGTMLDAVKQPLLAAEFEVVAASEEPEDIEAQEFLEENMDKMVRQSWRSHVIDMLEAIDFGFSVGEIVLEKRDDGKLWLKNIEPRGQETLFRWLFDEDDTVTHFQQQSVYTYGEFYSIPLDKTIHVTFRGRKGNPQGKSIMRSVYRPWYFCKNMENFEGIGVERDVGGMPIFILPEEPLETDDLNNLKAIVTSMRMDEQMGLILPHGSELRPYGSGTKKFNIGDIISRKQKEILMRMFAQFIMLGMQNVGTQALVAGSKDFFFLGLIAIQQVIEEAWNQQLVPYLFRFNDIKVSEAGLPKIHWMDPGNIDLVAMMNALSSAVGIGAVTPTPDDEEHLRNMLDLPEMVEEENLIDTEVPPGEEDEVVIPEMAIAGLPEPEEVTA